MTQANYNRTLVARMARKLKASRARPKTWDKRGGHLRLTTRGDSVFGSGLMMVRKMSVRQSHWWRRRSRRKRVRLIDHDRALLTLRLATQRAMAWKEARRREEAREHAGDALFDQCMNTSWFPQKTMAWPERYDNPLVTWSVFDSGWLYDRSIRLHVKQKTVLSGLGKTRFGRGHRTDAFAFLGNKMV